MRFKFQRGGTALIRNILSGFGFKECSETSMDYNLLWMNSHVKPFSLRNMLEFQARFLSFATVLVRIPMVELKIPGKAFLKSESRISVTFKL